MQVAACAVGPEVPCLTGIRVMLAERDDDLAVVWTLLLEWLGAEVVRLDNQANAPPHRDRDVLVFDSDLASTASLRSYAATLPTIVTGDAVDLPNARLLPKPVYPTELSRAILELTRHTAP
jgi:hypothetical protein